MAVKAIFSYICYTFLLSLAARINAIFPIEIETSLLNLRLFLNKNSSDFNVLKKSIKEIHETLPKKSNGELDNNFNVNTDIFKNWQTLTQEIFKHAADETGQNINIDSFINNLNYTSKKKNQLQSEIRIKYNGSSGFLSWTDFNNFVTSYSSFHLYKSFTTSTSFDSIIDLKNYNIIQDDK